MKHILKSEPFAVRLREGVSFFMMIIRVKRAEISDC